MQVAPQDIRQLTDFRSYALSRASVARLGGVSRHLRTVRAGAGILFAGTTAMSGLAACSTATHQAGRAAAGTVSVDFRPGTPKDAAVAVIVACLPKPTAAALRGIDVNGPEGLVAVIDLYALAGTRSALRRCLDSIPAVSEFQYQSHRRAAGLHLI